jgi:hypothetical protein
LGAAIQEDGQEGAKKTGRIGGRAIYILINTGFANLILQVVFLHIGIYAFNVGRPGLFYKELLKTDGSFAIAKGVKGLYLSGNPFL